MSKAELPTSIRLPADLKERLRQLAERESRTLSVQIVHILKVVTGLTGHVGRKRAPRKKRDG